MSRRFYFSKRICFVCLVLALLMLRASYWQFERYGQKNDEIATMARRLEEPIVDLASLLASPPLLDWSNLQYRRVRVVGEFDFEHEMLLRNRRYRGLSGAFAITPLRIELPSSQTAPSSTVQHVLVSRGFLPLSKLSRDSRREFQTPAKLSFVGLVKESSPAKLFAPQDPPTGPALPWVDAWLRVDLPSMQQQIPYQILPIYLEVMETPDQKGVEEQLVSTQAGREELFILPGHETALAGLTEEPELPYPLPVFDTIIPPGRHFGYIFEWAFMAFLTLGIGILLQLRPPRRVREAV